MQIIMVMAYTLPHARYCVSRHRQYTAAGLPQAHKAGVFAYSKFTMYRDQVFQSLNPHNTEPVLLY